MPDHDITIGELVRRIDASDKRWDERISQILAEMREDRRLNSEQFLRRDVYTANREADKEDVKDISRRMDSAEQFKRQIIVGAAVGLLLIVANIIVALMGLPGGAV